MRRYAEAPGEGAQQLEPAHPGDRRELGQRDLGRRSIVDALQRSCDRPRSFARPGASSVSARSRSMKRASRSSAASLSEGCAVSAEKRRTNIRAIGLVAKGRTHEFERARFCFFRHLVEDRRPQIDHPPAALLAAHGLAVVDFARVDRDHVPRERLDVSETAPRTMAAKRQQADPITLMRMTGKVARGREGHRLDARISGAMRGRLRALAALREVAARSRTPRRLQSAGQSGTAFVTSIPGPMARAHSHRPGPVCRIVTTSIRPLLRRPPPIQPDITQLVRLTTMAAKKAGQKPVTTNPFRK